MRGETAPIVLDDYLIDPKLFAHGQNAVALFEPRLIKDFCLVCKYEILLGDVGPHHAFAPQRARRFSRRNSMNACSGSGICRRLG